ncbi:MAG: YggT family protein [Terricaulis sp.]
MGLIDILFQLFRAVLGLAIAVLVIYVVLGWLFAFDLVSRRNAVVYSIYDFCRRLTDPMVRPFRRFIPIINGVDLSVLVLLLALTFLQGPISYWLQGVLTGRGPVL